MKTAYMFSGQGAQYPLMGKELFDNFSECREVFKEAEEALGFSVSDICFTENDKLNQTEFTQPAILTVSLAAFKLLEHKKPDFLLGLSLGEYSALTAANALSFKDSVKIVKTRGKLMQDAFLSGSYGMSAIMNLSKELTLESVNEASKKGFVAVANYNMPGQIVIAGETSALEEAEKIAKEKGAKKCIRLNVSGAFHTLLLKEASEKLRQTLDSFTINELQTPVVSNFSADFVKKEEVKNTLVNQMISSVRWDESVMKLLDSGVTRFVEIGCGKALCSFVKKIAASANKEVEIYNLEDLASFSKLKEANVI